MKRGRSTRADFGIKMMQRIGYALLLLGMFFGKRTAAQLTTTELSLKSLKPRDPIATRMADPGHPGTTANRQLATTQSGRSPASVKPSDPDIAALRPNLGQGEFMFYTATESSPKFMQEQSLHSGAEFRAVGFCRDRHGLWYDSAQPKSYASCLEGQPGSSSDAIGTGGRQAGFGLFIH